MFVSDFGRSFGRLLDLSPYGFELSEKFSLGNYFGVPLGILTLYESNFIICFFSSLKMFLCSACSDFISSKSSILNFKSVWFFTRCFFMIVSKIYLISLICLSVYILFFENYSKSSLDLSIGIEFLRYYTLSFICYVKFCWIFLWLLSISFNFSFVTAKF